MRITKTLGTAALASAASTLLLLASSGAAVADHTHAKVVGNGQCVVMAEGAGEEAVVLPSVVFTNNPNVDIEKAEGLAHPLHALVHRGQAGEHVDLYVYGTPAANAACASGYVNR